MLVVLALAIIAALGYGGYARHAAALVCCLPAPPACTCITKVVMSSHLNMFYVSLCSLLSLFHAVPSVSSPGSCLHAALCSLGIFFLCCITFNYLSAVFTPAGSPPLAGDGEEGEGPRSAQQRQQEVEEQAQELLEEKQRSPTRDVQSAGYHTCKKCSAEKPPRCHHCSQCGCCVLKFDHHCVSESNSFLMFLFCSCSCCYCYYLPLLIPVRLSLAALGQQLCGA